MRPADSCPVPMPPHFVRLLRQHFATHGTAPDGRLFRTNRDGLLQETGCGEVWAKVLDQTREHPNNRIDAALREWNEPE
jgi:hypothetical protein